MADNEETNKYLQLTNLFGQAEKLLSDLNDTAATMKKIITAASTDFEGGER